jgi:hypothetical protein
MTDLSSWVSSAIAHRAESDSGFGQSSLARMMSMSLGRVIDRSMINKVIHGSRDLSAEEMLCISQLTRFPLPGIRPSLRVSLRIYDGWPGFVGRMLRWSAPRVVETGDL